MDNPVPNTGPSPALEHRLEAYARSFGGSPDPAAFGATAAAAGQGVAISAEFARAVAARRIAVLAKVLLGLGLGAGVLALIVFMAMRAQPEPTRPTPRYGEEPTVWNLRPGVDDPGSLDNVAGLGAASGTSGTTANSPGVAPGSWPEDMHP